MDCGGVFVKYVLFVFNILFVVCGILLIVFGSLMLSNMGHIDSPQQAFETNSVPIIILVLGCIVFLISFMGCCGAIRENTCCMFTYSVVMLVLFVCQLALIIYVWTQRDQILKATDQAVDEIWKQRKTDQKAMDGLQLTFNCCGSNSFVDYGFDPIPLSCCGPSASSCGRTDVISKPGCKGAFRNYWANNTNIIRYAGLGVALVELVAFIFACCLANQVRNERRRANY